MLNFRKAQSREKELIKTLTGSTPEGVICFTFLVSSGRDFYESFLFGEENNEVKSIIFDTGDEYFLVYGEDFPELFTRCEKTIMIYEKKEAPQSSAKALEGRDIQEMYKLISGKNMLSFDDERRYVLRLRGVNAGLAAVFGIKKEGKLVSCASVSSMNENYGLVADVYTDIQERGRGLAADCLTAGVNFILEKGKIPLLLCDGEMCPYYEKAGFTVYGKM